MLTRTSGIRYDDAEDAHAICDVRTVDEQVGEPGGINDVSSFAVGSFGIVGLVIGTWCVGSGA